MGLLSILFFLILTSLPVYAEPNAARNSEKNGEGPGAVPGDANDEPCHQAQSRGVSHFDAGQFAEAAVAFAACPDWVLRPNVLTNMGFASHRAGDHASAVAAFLRAWSLAPLNPAVAQGFAALKSASAELSEPKKAADQDPAASALLPTEPWLWEGSLLEKFVWHSYRLLSQAQWLVLALLMQGLWLSFQAVGLFSARAYQSRGLARLRRLFMFLAFLLLGLVLVQQGQGSLGFGAVKVETLSLLSNPSEAGLALGTATKSQAFRVIGSHETWLQIHLSSGMKGWVESSQVVRFAPAILDAS